MATRTMEISRGRHKGVRAGVITFVYGPLNALGASSINTNVFHADRPYIIRRITAAWGTTETTATTYTLNLTKCGGAVAPSAGTSLLRSGGSQINLKSAANTTNVYDLTNTLASKTLATGDAIGAVFTSTGAAPVNLGGLCLTITLVPLSDTELHVDQLQPQIVTPTVVVNRRSGVYNRRAGSMVGRIIVAPSPLHASTDPNDFPFFIADRRYRVTGVRGAWSVVGGASAAANIRKCTGVQVPSAGVSLFNASSPATGFTASGFDLTSAVNTPRAANLTATTADLFINPGERLAVDWSGTLTGLAGFHFQVELIPDSDTLVTYDPVYGTFQDRPLGRRAGAYEGAVYFFNGNFTAGSGRHVDSAVFIADKPYIVERFSIRVEDDGTRILLPKKATSGTIAAGTAFTSTDDLDGSGLIFNTVTNIALITFSSPHKVATGDRLGYDWGGADGTVLGYTTGFILIPDPDTQVNMRDR